jgi:hypothetical protein
MWLISIYFLRCVVSLTNFENSVAAVKWLITTALNHVHFIPLKPVFNTFKLCILPTECIFVFRMVLTATTIASLNSNNWMVLVAEK